MAGVRACAVACRAAGRQRRRRRHPPQPPWFEDIADRAGIRFVHQSGHLEKFYLEIMGGGARS
jgi:hypothetical protein